MPNDRFQNKYRIASARAMKHEYDGETYFITTHDHIIRNQNGMNRIAHYVGNNVIAKVQGSGSVKVQPK